MEGLQDKKQRNLSGNFVNQMRKYTIVLNSSQQILMISKMAPGIWFRLSSNTFYI